MQQRMGTILRSIGWDCGSRPPRMGKGRLEAGGESDKEREREKEKEGKKFFLFLLC